MTRFCVYFDTDYEFALNKGVISVSLHEIILFRWYRQLWPAYSA
jgi:hypothetical protein